MSTRALTATGVVAAAAIALTGCTTSAAESESSALWRSATTVSEGGGFDQLVEDAQAEGTFNVMGLYEDWANYGGLLDAFSEKYGITINNDTSTGSSQDLVNAVVNRQGQDTSLDYLDTGMSYAVQADLDGLLAEYAPETIADIDPSYIGENGTWLHQYGGTIAIACDTGRVETCPTSFADLLDPQYRGQVALPNTPENSESAFMIVHAAALAHGGSLDDITPGIEFFRELNEVGNFIPVQGNAGTLETGETPILLEWTYTLQPVADRLADEVGMEIDVIIPDDGVVSSFYAASLNADAPHPATARLFFEFLFSDEGQNLLLQGGVSPVRLDAMIAAGTVDEDALAALPSAELGQSPTLEQRQANQDVIDEQWSAAIR
ncbi:ABC transporter substrate-binding protein [Microbacterium amylolyticum]|uniref:Spermidine/putrescine transport system substrate-binding protein n=1 Tax=Microbacterium amylolyticum TaxID=936337 RepID=A0ABS4ZG11_9MICO|nr:extracellular solute-binding protein [Microbacterium amylolyticum]MBP2435421.1 putative spermidine/putrescine transport system substrate-binding protein [Microbacterium amylolyticum]